MVSDSVNNVQYVTQLRDMIPAFKALKSYENGLYRAAFVAVEAINRRAKSGISADGQVLFTKSSKRVGAYSEQHAESRTKRRLQVQSVDLTFTGQMLRNFNLLTLRPNFVTIGFSAPTQAAKAAKLENYYGTDIMTVSNAEESDAVDALEKEILRTLDQLF